MQSRTFSPRQAPRAVRRDSRASARSPARAARRASKAATAGAGGSTRASPARRRERRCAVVRHRAELHHHRNAPGARQDGDWLVGLPSASARPPLSGPVDLEEARGRQILGADDRARRPFAAPARPAAERDRRGRADRRNPPRAPAGTRPTPPDVGDGLGERLCPGDVGRGAGFRCRRRPARSARRHPAAPAGIRGWRRRPSPASFASVAIWRLATASAARIAPASSAPGRRRPCGLTPARTIGPRA